MFELVFWQRIVSPHMAYLAKAVANLGYKVRYVTTEPMSKDRIAQGWRVPDIEEVKLDYITDLTQIDQFLKRISPEAVHLVQGLRGNGYVGHVINRLKQCKARWGTVLETIREPFVTGPIKRLVYNYKFVRGSHNPDFVLAIGEKTPAWVAARNYPEQRIFPFTYFLATGQSEQLDHNKRSDSFRVGFVGQLNKGKRVDILIDALAFDGFHGMEIVIVGSGPLEAELKAIAQKQLRHLNVQWLGQLSMAKARSEIAAMDCLVLPSNHDGWGAVVSEALMEGVPAICSDACGAAAAVRASGLGGVFKSGNVLALRQLLAQAKAVGRLGSGARKDLACWASCFGVVAGAAYLSKILEGVYANGIRPEPPWCGSGCCQVGLRES